MRSLSPCCQDHFEPHKVWVSQFPQTLIFTSKCFKENPFTNPGMYLLRISGFDISHMWMSPWLNGLKSAPSALHIMYYSSLFAKWSLYRLYIIHFIPYPRQGQLYLGSIPTATNTNMYHRGGAFHSLTLILSTSIMTATENKQYTLNDQLE